MHSDWKAQMPGRGYRRITTIAVVVALYATFAMGGQAQAPHLSHSASSLIGPNKPVPKLLAALVPQVKTRSRLPILLPSELPAVIGSPAHGHLDRASANEYEVSLYYELGVGNAGFAAAFSAETGPGYEPQDLTDVEKVQLLSGLVGYFSPVSCGGSCAPANIN
jgi:hypothetical protein